MNNDFISAVKQIAAERGLEMDDVLNVIKQAIIASVTNSREETLDIEEGSNVQVDIDAENSQIAVYADKKVVDEVTNDATQISVADAQKIQPKLKEGDHILVEITHSIDFGRIAAQAARQVFMQGIRDVEHEAIMKQFTDKIGTIETAIIQRMDRESNVILEIYRAIAKMPQEEQIQSEFYQSGSRIKVLIKKIQEDAKGKTLIVSRADKDFLKALFEMEVPEIASGTVEIMKIAREAGSRSKVAVRSNAEGVDPIGSCVGQRGARINAITNELKTNRGEEKIDIIPWDEDEKTFLANSIRPAEAVEVRIVNAEERQALIIVDDESLSLAIGREGQNVRLAAKLTDWKIDIQGTKAYEEAGKLSKFEIEAGVVPTKDKKSDKASDVEVEASTSESSDSETTSTESESVFSGLELSARTVSALEKAGITSVEDLTAKISADEKIAGVGPKAVEEIKSALKLD